MWALSMKRRITEQSVQNCPRNCPFRLRFCICVCQAEPLNSWFQSPSDTLIRSGVCGLTVRTRKGQQSECSAEPLRWSLGLSRCHSTCQLSPEGVCWHYFFSSDECFMKLKVPKGAVRAAVFLQIYAISDSPVSNRQRICPVRMLSWNQFATVWIPAKQQGNKISGSQPASDSTFRDGLIWQGKKVISETEISILGPYQYKCHRTSYFRKLLNQTSRGFVWKSFGDIRGPN